jgi:class 3 adenylate cyclase
LAAEPVDLVLLDVMMPRLDGFGVLKRMKAHEAWRHLPVIMISAVTDMTSVVKGIELGAEDYLPKPFEPVLLQARIGACLEKKRLRDQEQAHLAEITRQRARADGLLHAILPRAAVAELVATGRVEPRRHPEVAVLFLDVAGFTSFSERHPPEHVVACLEHLVSAFERAAETHGLEKLKTVGDALVATANLHLPHDDPAAACLACAGQLIAAARAGPAAWELHGGLDVGPVVSGVLGTTKLAFDIWGDTINMAARLGALPGQGCVNLSEAAWRRLDGRIEVEAIGPIELRGKGPSPVWRWMG